MTPTPKAADTDDGVAALSYSEASAELDGIIEEFEAGVIDVDRLVERLQRATAIVDELDRRLRRTRMQVEELVPRLEAVGRPDDGEDDVEIEYVEELEIVEIDIEESSGDVPEGLF
jgi:exodeoxyribonuclease VII small subunit